jgi:hypothetical protein
MAPAREPKVAARRLKTLATDPQPERLEARGYNRNLK